MRPLLLLLLPSLVALTTPAHAQTVNRCLDAHGNPVFSDQPCSALQATPVQAAAASSNTLPSGAPMPLARCAATTDALRQHVIDAFATRDPNQLAGLMLWNGYGHGAAVGDIRALASLVRQPLLQVQLAGGDPASTSSTASSSADTLQVQTAGGGSASFAITHEAGCLWLRQND